MGALGALVGGASLMMNRFTGPDDWGLQSMTYHEPQAEGAQQAGGQSNVGGMLVHSSATSSNPRRRVRVHFLYVS